MLCLATMYSSGFNLSHGVVDGESSSIRAVGYTVDVLRNHLTNVSIFSRPAFERPLKKNKTMVYLVILILSAPANKEKRHVIRQTWMLNSPNTVSVFFVVGMKNLQHRKQSNLFNEQDHNADLIMLPNLIDDYKNLTTEVIESMKWVNEKFKYQYLLKTDDDSFVRVGEILESLKVKQTEMLYMGFFYRRNDIIHEGKWAEPKQYICDS